MATGLTRAERRRQEKMNQTKVKTYTITDRELAAMKKQITDDAVKTATLLMLALPMEVLSTDYWPKTYQKKLPEFNDKVLSLYRKWMDGELDMERLKDDLWEKTGIRMEL